ncbi:MAG: alpha/beta hydrolase [Actinomycetota bacterium]|nr:alpha/beta hydrolase [Actinomycetota bacterium]
MSAAQSPARIEIERPGGTLVLHQLAAGSGGPVVVLLHGITANAYSWLAAANSIAAAHPDATILAPDLRGRADSRAIIGPWGLAIDATLTATIGPAMQRLSMTFADAGAYLLHDLVPSAGGVVSSCVLDAVRADGADVLADPATHAAVRTAAEAGAGIEFLWAARGMLNEQQRLYDEQRLAAIGVPQTVGVTAIPDVNHYSVLFQQASVDAIVKALGRLIARR